MAATFGLIRVETKANKTARPAEIVNRVWVPMRRSLVATLLLILAFSSQNTALAQGRKGWIGLALQTVTHAVVQEKNLTLPFGILVSGIAAQSPAANQVKIGDVILSVDGLPVQTEEAFLSMIEAHAPGDRVTIVIAREKQLLALEIVLKDLATASALLLRLDTGGHQNLIRGLAFSPDDKFLVSAGDDKVARVWDWRRVRTVRTISGQSGLGNEGKLYAMALSPDGRWLAVGGYTSARKQQVGDVRLHDVASGELRALLNGHDDVIFGLAFSPDSKRLISGSYDTSAIIWDVEEGKLLHRLTGHRGEIYAVGFTADSERAVTGSDDGTLRLWNVLDGALLQELAGHADKVRAIALAPRGTRLASGDTGGEIRVWEHGLEAGAGGTDKSTSVSLGHQGGYVGSLTFSPNGRLLLSTCGYDGCNSTQHVFDSTSGKSVTAYRGHDDKVVASTFSRDGRFVATAGGNRFPVHIWDPRTGETQAILQGTGLQVWSASFSEDGQSIAWGHEASPMLNRTTGLEFQLRLPGFGQALLAPTPVTSQKAWQRAITTLGALSLQHRKGGNYGYEAILDLLKDGKALASIERGPADGYFHGAYSFTPDGQTIVTGGVHGILASYNLDGVKLGNFVGHDGDIQAVSPSPDGKYLLSGSADQTVRLWNLKTREPIVALYRGIDGEWVMWTPQGYYTGSPGADKIVGWQINKGPDKAADYVTAEQLRRHLNRPDIVAKAIQLASAEQAVRTSYGTEFRLSDLLARPVPGVRILSPAADSTVKAAGSAWVEIAVRATPDPVKRIRIQVDGRQLDDFLPGGRPSFESGAHFFNVPLAKGKNTIVITALNDIGWSKVQDGTLTLENEGDGELDKRGTLYILAVGVTKYPGIRKLCGPNRTCDLKFTGNDAVAFADTMQQRLGALHKNVIRRVLVNGGKSKDVPTAANIIDALGLLRRSQSNDTVAVFLAGHGMNDGPNYRFVSTDAASADDAIRPSSVVPWHAIEEAIDGAKGRRLLFIDTCHSAGAYNERLGNAAYHANVIAYSAARWDQLALESSEFRHGLFTQALVEGLRGAADIAKTGRVDTSQLNDYLQRRVPELASSFKYEQNPQFFKARDAQTFVLAELH